jgi:hypothetical protein
MAKRDLGLAGGFEVAVTPAGVVIGLRIFSRGVAALDPWLIAFIPAGWRRSRASPALRPSFDPGPGVGRDWMKRWRGNGAHGVVATICFGLSDLRGKKRNGMERSRTRGDGMFRYAARALAWAALWWPFRPEDGGRLVRWPGLGSAPSSPTLLPHTAMHEASESWGRREPEDPRGGRYF